jgi:hypothetical protein
MKEAAITINGVPLTTAQAMTVRVALGSFAMDLQNHHLGGDEHGEAMTRGYLAAIYEIHQMMRIGP